MKEGIQKIPSGVRAPGEHSNSHHNITYEIYFYFVRIKIYLSFNQIKKYGANFLKNRGKKCGANLRVLFIPLFSQSLTASRKKYKHLTDRYKNKCLFNDWFNFLDI